MNFTSAPQLKKSQLAMVLSASEGAVPTLGTPSTATATIEEKPFMKSDSMKRITSSERKNSTKDLGSPLSKDPLQQPAASPVAV